MSAEYEMPTPKDALLQQLASSAEMQTTSQEEYYQYMGQIYYLIKDEQVLNDIMNDPDLRVLLPMFSHLNRTSNIDTDQNGKRVSACMKIRARRALRLQLMVNKNPNLVSQAQFDAMVNFTDGVVEDQKGGWRGRLLTEKIKTYKIEGGSSGSRTSGGGGGLFAKLFGR